MAMEPPIEQHTVTTDGLLQVVWFPEEDHQLKNVEIICCRHVLLNAGEVP